MHMGLHRFVWLAWASTLSAQAPAGRGILTADLLTPIASDTTLAHVWRGATVAVLVVPVQVASKRPNPIRALPSIDVVQPAWRAAVRAASYGLTDVAVGRTPTLRSRHDRPGALALAAVQGADSTTDLARYADPAGRVRSLVVAVAGSGVVAAITSVPMRFVARYASRRVLVESVTLVPVATVADLSSVLTSWAVLAPAMGVPSQHVLRYSDGRMAWSPEVRARLGWLDQLADVWVTTEIQFEARDGPVGIRVPIPDDSLGGRVVVESAPDTTLRIRRYALGTARAPGRCWMDSTVARGASVLLPLRGRADRLVAIAWDSTTAHVQVALSSVGADRVRAQRAWARVWP